MWIASMSVVFTDPSPEESALYNMDAVVIYFFFFYFIEIKIFNFTGFETLFPEKSSSSCCSSCTTAKPKERCSSSNSEGQCKKFFITIFLLINFINLGI